MWVDAEPVGSICSFLSVSGEVFASTSKCNFFAFDETINFFKSLGGIVNAFCELVNDLVCLLAVALVEALVPLVHLIDFSVGAVKNFYDLRTTGDCCTNSSTGRTSYGSSNNSATSH